MIVFFMAMFFGELKLERTIKLEHVYREQHPMAVSDQGIICLLDTREGELLYFDPEGTFLKRVSGKGRGPGELAKPTYLSWVTERNAFSVCDSGSSRVSFWDEDGKLLQEYKANVNLEKIQFISGTQILGVWDNHGVKGSRPRVIRRDLVSAHDDVFFALPVLEKPIGLHIEETGLKVSLKFDWDPGLIHTGNTAYLVVNNTESNRIYLLKGKNGQEIRRIQVPIPRYTFRKDDVEAPFQKPGAARFYKQVRPHIQAPEFWPYFQALHLDGDLLWCFSPKPVGREWVHVTVTDLKGTIHLQTKLKNRPAVIKSHRLYSLSLTEEEDVYLNVYVFDRS